MADTTFVSKVTKIATDWLQAINNHVYRDEAISPATTVHAAANIANTPAGTLAATTVQAALNELDTEKATLAGSASQVFSVAQFSAVEHAPRVAQPITVWTRAVTTALGTTLNGTLSDTSTTITEFSGLAGVTYHCRALGAGSITHHATNLIITQTGASIDTAAGDTFDVEMLTATTCRVKNYQRASGSALVFPNNNASAPLAAVWTTTTQLPLDDSIPQNTEGTEVITVSITPKKTTNRLLIQFSSFCTSAASSVAFALFQDSIANALSATCVVADGGAALSSKSVSLRHEMAAGTTSTITFKIRCGPGAGGYLTTINGSGGARLFGGVASTLLTVTEFGV